MNYIPFPLRYRIAEHDIMELSINLDKLSVKEICSARICYDIKLSHVR